MSAQCYINKRRILAEASITKVQYPKGVSNVNKLSSTLNCDANFEEITYKEICRPCVYISRPLPIDQFARFNNQIAVISNTYQIYSSNIVSYTPTTITVTLDQTTTQFDVPYIIVSSVSQLAGLTPLANRFIIFNDTLYTFTLNFTVLNIQITLPPGQLLFSITGIEISFIIV